MEGVGRARAAPSYLPSCLTSEAGLLTPWRRPRHSPGTAPRNPRPFRQGQQGLGGAAGQGAHPGCSCARATARPEFGGRSGRALGFPITLLLSGGLLWGRQRGDGVRHPSKGASWPLSGPHPRSFPRDSWKGRSRGGQGLGLGSPVHPDPRDLNRNKGRTCSTQSVLRSQPRGGGQCPASYLCAS